MSEAELEILQNLLMVLIKVAIPPVVAWALYELKQLINQLKRNKDWEHVHWAVHAAVKASEQLGLTDQLAEYGESKLDVAIQFVEAQLEAQGIALDLDQYEAAIRAMIEAEVREQFGHDDTDTE